MLFFVTFVLQFHFLLLYWSLHFSLLHGLLFHWLFLHFPLFFIRYLFFFGLFRRFWRLVFIIVGPRFRLLFSRVFVIGHNEVISFFGLDFILVDGIRIRFSDFFEDSFELDSIIGVGFKHDLGLIVLFLFFFLKLDFFHLCFFGLLSFFSFFLLSLLYLLKSLSFLLLSALFLFWVQSEFVSGRDNDILLDER